MRAGAGLQARAQGLCRNPGRLPPAACPPERGGPSLEWEDSWPEWGARVRRGRPTCLEEPFLPSGRPAADGAVRVSGEKSGALQLQARGGGVRAGPVRDVLAPPALAPGFAARRSEPRSREKPAPTAPLCRRPGASPLGRGRCQWPSCGAPGAGLRPSGRGTPWALSPPPSPRVRFTTDLTVPKGISLPYSRDPLGSGDSGAGSLWGAVLGAVGC